MPDLTTSFFPTCSSNIAWQRTTDKGYKVSYGKNRGPYVYNWHCTCKGFKFKKTCKHVKQAKTEKCSWGSLAWVAEDVSKGQHTTHCPECGADVQYIQVGV